MDQLIEFFKALADSNRLRIINLLLNSGELCVCDIERVLGIPQARVSRHLNILRHTRIVRGRRSGQWMHYRLMEDDSIRKAFYDHLRTAVRSAPELKHDIRVLRSSRLLVCMPSLNTGS